MSKLPLPSIEIRNFRAFRHLAVERLTRMNLIVGKNNVGKTSLLEALWLYAQRGTWSAIWDLIERRNEGTRPRDGTMSTIESAEAQARSYAQLFYQRRDLANWKGSIQIKVLKDQRQALQIMVDTSNHDQNSSTDGATGLMVSRGLNESESYPFDMRSLGIRRKPTILPVQIVSVYGLSPSELAQLWDAITLTDSEDDVVQALRLLEPRVLRVNVRAEPDRHVIVRMRDLDQQVRLQSLGEGMNRIFGIALALVNAKNGILLLDEVENGLHYAVQPAVWQLLFAVAERLNVQVFATTHSKDCIAAFQQAATAHPDTAQIIRLGRKADDVVATLFDQTELETVVANDVEVR